MLRLELTEEERVRLETFYRESSHLKVRERAQGLLLLSQGYSRSEISALLEKRLDTISGWYHRYQSERTWDLTDAARSGRPSKWDTALKKS